MPIFRVSGRDNIVLNNCNVTIINQGYKELTPSPSLGLAGSSKAGTVVKQPKRRAHIREEEDEAPPKKKKRATLDTDKENIPKVQYSTMPKVFKNVKKSHRVRVEVESSDQKDTKKWLPGMFRAVDSSGWGHLLLDKEKGKEEPIPITKKTSDTDKFTSQIQHKVGQEVKIPCVKYNDVKKKFQTVGDCVVKL